MKTIKVYSNYCYIEHYNIDSQQKYNNIDAGNSLQDYELEYNHPFLKQLPIKFQKQFDEENDQKMFHLTKEGYQNIYRISLKDFSFNNSQDNKNMKYYNFNWLFNFKT